MSEKAREVFIEAVVRRVYDSNDTGANCEVWQDRPNTAVSLTVDGCRAYGFTKVSWPDDWDPEYGEDVALRKAAAKIWRSIER